MGYWDIESDNEDDMWGDGPADEIDEYCEYLLVTDRERLHDRPQLIQDAKILIWFHAEDIEREFNDVELDYGFTFAFGQKEDYATIYIELRGAIPNIVPADTPAITYQEIETHIGLDVTGSVISYMWYLKDRYPERLASKDHMLEATRLLTYMEFFALKERVATEAEIKFILEACLHRLPWMALVK